MDNLPTGLTRYTLTGNHGQGEVSIVAKSKAQAWEKFCCQRFGALKPVKTDWVIKGE